MGKKGTDLKQSKISLVGAYNYPHQKNGRNTGNGEAWKFTPAEALADFSAEFLDADACRSWILHRLHPGGPACPHCGRSITDERRHHRWNTGKRIQCLGCSRFFTSTTGTFLAGKHSDPATVFLMAVLIGLDVRNDHAANIIGCDPETVRIWRHRFEGIERGKQ